MPHVVAVPIALLLSVLLFLARTCERIVLWQFLLKNKNVHSYRVLLRREMVTSLA